MSGPPEDAGADGRPILYPQVWLGEADEPWDAATLAGRTEGRLAFEVMDAPLPAHEVSPDRAETPPSLEALYRVTRDPAFRAEVNRLATVDRATRRAEARRYALEHPSPYLTPENVEWALSQLADTEAGDAGGVNGGRPWVCIRGRNARFWANPFSDRVLWVAVPPRSVLADVTFHARGGTATQAAAQKAFERALRAIRKRLGYGSLAGRPRTLEPTVEAEVMQLVHARRRSAGADTAQPSWEDIADEVEERFGMSLGADDLRKRYARWQPTIDPE